MCVFVLTYVHWCMVRLLALQREPYQGIGNITMKKERDYLELLGNGGRPYHFAIIILGFSYCNVLSKDVR